MLFYPVLSSCQVSCRTVLWGFLMDSLLIESDVLRHAASPNLLDVRLG